MVLADPEALEHLVDLYSLAVQSDLAVPVDLLHQKFPKNRYCLKCLMTRSFPMFPKSLRFHLYLKLRSHLKCLNYLQYPNFRQFP